MTDLIEKIADTIEPWLEENDRSQMKVAQDVIKTIEAEGYRIVPYEATAEMSLKAQEVTYEDGIEIYQAILDAAPKVGE